ncbi:MAG: glycoside hydrolase [Chloroflexi bacterium]|nr:glycoside hydrolase [Chloroflexota bacterium]
MLKKDKIRGSEQIKVTFVLPADHPHIHASVMGTFNEWNPSANKLVKRNNGTYSTAVNLDPGGRYEFRYFATDGTWFNDEAADGYEPGEYGSDNCIVET